MGEIGAAELPTIHSRPALAAFIRGHIVESGRLDNSMLMLPDGEPDVGGLTFVAGALDSLLGSGGGSSPDDLRSDEIAGLLLAAADDPSERQLRALYEAVDSDDIVGLIDPTIDALIEKNAGRDDVARMALWLASTAPDRGPLKLAIALLGVSGNPDPELLMVLGAHEEFTAYVATAIANSSDDAEHDLYRLAQRVRGWGRVHCVDMLADTTDPEIARWLLLEGHRNDATEPGPALIAARVGGLADVIDVDAPDRDLLTAAGDILEALLDGRMAIDEYSAAPAVMRRWLEHMDTRAETLEDFSTMRAIRLFVDRDDWDWRVDNTAWTAEDRERVRDHTEQLMHDPRWPAVIERGMESSDQTEFFVAVMAAQYLGIDVFDRLVRRVEADPLDGPWYQAWAGADTGRAGVLVDAATRVFDLDEIASGPSDQLGLGPGFEPHSAFNWSLQGLVDHPGIGGHLVTVGLQSPSVINRNTSLRVLEAWGQSEWTDEHRHLVEHAAATDPSDSVRDHAANALTTS